MQLRRGCPHDGALKPGLGVANFRPRGSIVSWSDGTEGEALRRIADEVLVCEGDLIGKTQAESGSLHFRRDRD